MSKYIYQTLASFGYHHPLHPILAHLPIGLTMAGFLFSLIAVLRGKTVLAQTARHCMVLGLVSLLPTVILGYMDWQHFYNGAYLVPIKMKLMLAFVLGPMLEKSLRQSLVISQGSPLIFLNRPISLALMAVTLLFVLSPIVTMFLKRHRFISWNEQVRKTTGL